MDEPHFILWKCGGPRYLTRDGRLAVVLESNVDDKGSLWQGRVNGEWTEWNRDGTHRGGDSALDIDPLIHAKG